MVNTLYFLAIFLVFLRMSTFFMVIPSFFAKGIPNTFKIFFVMILSYILINTVDYNSVSLINNTYMLVMYCINEVVTGLTLGFVTSIIFYVMSLAGSLMDIHIGLSMLSMYDPNTQSTNTLFAKLINWIAIIMFFITDTHHVVIGQLVQSYSVVKMGKSIIYQETISAVFNDFTQYFIIGIKIALPITFIILMTDVVLGLISRTVPQIQVMILGMPIKILVGVISVIVGLPVIINFIVSAFNNIPDAFKGIYNAMPMVMPLFFIFASDDKTEEATPKKLSDARKKGQVARSKDLGLAITLAACTVVILVLGGSIAKVLRDTLVYYLSKNFKTDFSELFISHEIMTAMLQMAKAFLPMALIIMVSGIIASIIQTGFMFTKEGLKPSFSKLNPINGLKNMFSMRSLVDLIKNLAVVCVVSYVGYLFIKENYYTILQFGNVYMPDIGKEMQTLVVDIFKQITLVIVVIAILDFVYQKFKFKKDMKMTKEEVKEEYKQSEGDPQIKSKIKQKQREIASRRMMQAVPDATVVITNPTHYAVALKYTEGQMESPKVVAKGADFIALKIKEKAQESEVPIIENKPLARLIYDKVEIDEEIPQEMYQAVAEVLAIVFKMQNKH